MYGVFARVMIRAREGQMMSRSKLEMVHDLDRQIRNITVKSDAGDKVEVYVLHYYINDYK